MADAANDVRATVERVVAALNAHDVAALRESIEAPDDVWAPWERSFVAFFEAFPDFHQTIEQIVVDGDSYGLHVLCEGTHAREYPAGELAGIPATGKRLSWHEANFGTVKDGKMEASDLVIGGVERLQQLGALPAPGPDFPA